MAAVTRTELKDTAVRDTDVTELPRTVEQQHEMLQQGSFAPTIDG